MPLTGEVKKIWQRNYNRTRQYGPTWRQLFYNSMGMCENCGSNRELDIHEEHDKDDLQIKEYHLLCIHCHLDDRHSSDIHPDGRYRKYVSMLAEDLLREMMSCGTLETWLGTYHVHNTDPDKFAYWESYIAALREPESPVVD
jgi:hypothetical protein